MEMVFGYIGFSLFCLVILIWMFSPASGGSGGSVNYGKCRVCKMPLETSYPGGAHPSCYPSRKGHV